MRPRVVNVRGVVLAVVLALTALVVPSSTVASTQSVLVKVERASGVDLPGDDTVWVLAVGSDARPGEDMLRTRGDALQLVGMNLRTGAATAIGIPRDSYVSIPGHGTGRVNAALTYGGPDLLGRTVGDLVGIAPDYVFVTRFPFFEDMVDDIGGISVRNPRPFSDPYLKREGFQAGTIRLGGYDAMAFSRIRKSLPGGDFDRSANQQRVLRGIHQRIRSQADRPGFVGQRGAQRARAHGDRGGAARPVPDRPGRGGGPLGLDHHVRARRHDRDHRRRERRAAEPDPGPPLRRRRAPRRRDHQLLIRWPGEIRTGTARCRRAP